MTQRHRASAIFLAIALAVLCGHGAGAQAASQGQWRTLPTLMPINPIHIALLNTGKVLIVAGSGNDETETHFKAGVWDPQAGTIVTQAVTWDMFCNGMTMLADGRAFVNGGNLGYDPFTGLSRNSIYDPVTGLFTDVENTAHGRWYPTATLLGDGRVMSFSGLDETGATNTAVEIYTLGSGWSPEHPAGWVPPLYPREHLLPNGSIFYSGSSTASRLFNPSTAAWSPVLATTNYSGTRRYGTAVLLPLSPADNYRARVMIMGGGSPATATTEIIEPSAPSPQWTNGPAMSQARIEMSATILPNGTILTTGGSIFDEDATTASLNAEIYNPATNAFSPAGANAFPRMYHSGSLLLPDATVAIFGGNPVRRSFEPHIEIYSPPYLFNADGSAATRPTIASVTPGPLNYGAAFQVQTPDAASVSSVVLVRPGTPTHSFDMDQRLVALSFTAGSGVLNATMPPNSNIAAPGYYMLFVLNAAGVPSTATFVQLLPSSPDQRPTATITSPSTDLVVQPGGSVSFAGTGTDPNGTIAGYSWSFPGGTPSSSALSSPGNIVYSTPGTYVASLRVTDNSGLGSQIAALRIITVPDFTLSATPASETVLPGGTATYSASITATAGLTGATTFSVTGLPAGATASVNPASIVGSGSTVLSVATNSVPAGTYPITIRATNGSLTRTAPLTLVIGGCEDTLNLSYASGTLNIGFKVGTTTPGTWSVWLIAQNQVYPLWAVQLPALTPAAPINIPIPGFPNVGMMYVVTTLNNSGGAQCVDARGINTSP
jgi:galactose oxidase-like protein/PKD domain-containing protein